MPWEPYIGDFMSNLADGMRYGGLVGPPLHIRDFHFVDVLDFSLKELPNGGSNVFKTRQGQVQQTVTPKYNEAGVQIGEEVTFPRVGESSFKIDSLREPNLVQKDTENEKRVVK